MDSREREIVERRERERGGLSRERVYYRPKMEGK